MIQVAGFQRQQQLSGIKQNQLEAFAKAPRNKLLDKSSGFVMEYLKLLVNGIRIKDNRTEITDSYSALVHAATESNSTLQRVLSFVPKWLAKTDKSGHWNLVIFIQ